MSKKQLIRHGVTLLVITIVITYIIPFALTGQSGSVSRVIGLTFDGIGEGKDPKGNHFDINVIKSDEVLNAAIKKSELKGKMTAKELRGLIAVLPHVSERALDNLTSFTPISDAIKTQNIAQRRVHPSQFTIQMKDRGVPSILRDRRLLDNIVDAYKEQLENTYLLDSDEKLIYTKKEILDLDYPEMMDVIRQQSQTLERLSNGFVRTAPKFIDEKTGLSFGDMHGQVQALQNNELKSLEGIVEFYQISKNVDRRETYEEFALRRVSYNLEKALEKETAVQQRVDQYNNQESYVNVLSDSSELNTSSDDSFYGALIQQLVASKAEVTNIRFTKQKIEAAIKKLEQNGLTQDQYNAQMMEAGQEAEDILDRLEFFRSQIKALAKANYEENIASKISVGGISYDTNGGNFLVNFLVLLILYAVWMTMRERGCLKDAGRWLVAQGNGIKAKVLLALEEGLKKTPKS